MAAATVQSSTNLFRQLAWNASVPIEVRLADGEAPGAAVDKYYRGTTLGPPQADQSALAVQAPRYTYLPLLLPQIKDNLVSLALDDDQLAKTNETQWWFEEDSEEPGLGGLGACRWHWPVDLLDLNATIARPVRRNDPAVSSASKSSPSVSTPRSPLKLILHLSSPPQDKLTLPPGVESCRSHFTSQVKEADFVRWGNTKRVTGMRRQDLEAGWDGVIGGDYDLHSRMGARLVPMPIALGTSTPSSNVPSRPPSTEPGQTSSVPKLESAYAARSLPIKIYLPDAPAMQHVVPPLTDGKPTTLLAFLRTHYPLLFPTTASEPYALAVPYVLGIVVPPDSEVAWLASCMCGADGWVRIGLGLVGE